MSQRATAWLVFGVVLAVLLATAQHGIVRDEGYYFRAAAEYHQWFVQAWNDSWRGELGASFTQSALRRGFGYNSEHPGLVKITMGFTHASFAEVLGWTSHATGFRLGAMLFVAMGAAFTYLLGAAWFGSGVGLGSVALLLACPHVFYHAHLACFDGPVTGLIVATTYAFWRARESRAWAVACGLLFGLALAAKHNAVFAAVGLGVAWLAANRVDVRAAWQGLRVPSVPLAFLTMAVLGPLVLYVFYPQAWLDPLGQLSRYYGYHLRHEHYPVEYFGTILWAPPFPVAFPWVMTAVTVPAVVLLLSLGGLGAIATGRLMRRDALARWLLLMGALVPPLVIAWPTVPVFGGTKHWMPMMPFWCLAAAALGLEGLRWLWTWRPLAATALGCACAASLASEARGVHPLGHVYYNELVGGVRGAAKLGMARTFWGGESRALLPALNRLAEPGARIYTHRMNHSAFRAYQADGLLRADLRWSSHVAGAQWALINHMREYPDAEHEVWQRNEHRVAEEVVVVDGVPIVSLYRVGHQ